jgi:hypothetical protein
MKNKLKVLLGIIITAYLSGCAGNREAMNKPAYDISKYSAKSRTETSLLNHEFADVYISASIKTHKPGIYIFDNKKHGTDKFTVTVYIDGKPLQMNSSINAEDTSYLHEKHPEAGDGIRYNFRGSIRLKPGKHMLALSVPEDNIFELKDIYIKEGSNKIVIEPVYNRRKPYRKIGFVGDTSFYEGIKRFKVVVNGMDR